MQSSLLFLVLAGVGCSSDPSDSDRDTETQAVPLPPSNPEIAIEPASPIQGDDLLCSVVTPSVDPDGEEVSYTYVWTVDGAPAEVDGDTVPGDRVGAWQGWTCAVVASDGDMESAEVVADVTTTDECVSVASDGTQVIGVDVRSSDQFDVGLFGEAMTMEGWFKVSKPAAGEGDFLFYKGDLTSGPSSYTLDYMLGVVDNGAIHFATARSGTGDPCNYLVIEDVMVWDTWMHIAATMDPVSRTKQVFVDGELIKKCTASTKAPARNGPLTIAGHMMAGRDGRLFPSHQIGGKVDEVRISRSVRYTENFRPSPWLVDDSDTQVLYHFNEGSGTEVSDHSSNNHVGLLLVPTWSDDDSACEGYWAQ